MVESGCSVSPRDSLSEKELYENTIYLTESFRRLLPSDQVRGEFSIIRPNYECLILNFPEKGLIAYQFLEDDQKKEIATMLVLSEGQEPKINIQIFSDLDDKESFYSKFSSAENNIGSLYVAKQMLSNFTEAVNSSNA